MIEFKRDEDGILVAYKDGQKVGIIATMGDDVKKPNESPKRPEPLSQKPDSKNNTNR